MKHVLLPIGTVLYEPGDLLYQVHFINSGIVSVLSLMQDHTTMEVGMVGLEGVVGLPLFFGSAASASRAIVRSAGTAVSIKANALREELGRRGSLMQVLLQYADLLLTQSAQLVVCNRFHTLDARIACWLLRTQDRAQSDEFRITQEQMSQMLGVRRVGVTNGAARFQRQKLISYSRGHMKILNRVGLENAACECYRRINAI